MVTQICLTTKPVSFVFVFAFAYILAIMAVIQQLWSPNQKSSMCISWHLDDSDTDGPETTLGNTVLRKVASRSPESPGSLDGAWIQG